MDGRVVGTKHCFEGILRCPAMAPASTPRSAPPVVVPFLVIITGLTNTSLILLRSSHFFE